MKSKKYAIYARSNQEVIDSQSTSISRQVRSLQELARKQELEVIGVYTEFGSANATVRPQFNKVLDHVEAGKVNGIICFGWDRLARNFINASKVGQLMESKGLEVITPHQTFRKGLDFIVSFMFPAMMSSLESKDRSDRIKKGIAAAKTRKTAIYLRVSSESQQDYLLAEQRKEVKKHAKNYSNRVRKHEASR